MIGLPGEQVSERNGFFYVDGKKLNEPYLDAARPRLGHAVVAAARQEASTS